MKKKRKEKRSHSSLITQYVTNGAPCFLYKAMLTVLYAEGNWSIRGRVNRKGKSLYLLSFGPIVGTPFCIQRLLREKLTRVQTSLSSSASYQLLNEVVERKSTLYSFLFFFLLPLSVDELEKITRRRRCRRRSRLLFVEKKNQTRPCR